jgi:hypothetical protein
VIIGHSRPQDGKIDWIGILRQVFQGQKAGTYANHDGINTVPH